jgi:hypothetical protein
MHFINFIDRPITSSTGKICEQQSYDTYTYTNPKFVSDNVNERVRAKGKTFQSYASPVVWTMWHNVPAGILNRSGSLSNYSECSQFFKSIITALSLLSVAEVIVALHH